LDYVEGAVGNVSTVIDIIKIIIFLPDKTRRKTWTLRYRFWKPLPQGDFECFSQREVDGGRHALGQSLWLD